MEIKRKNDQKIESHVEETGKTMEEVRKKIKP